MVDQRIADHSYAYGTYLAAMTAGLIAAGAWGYGALYALMFGSLIWLTQRRVGAPTWRNQATELAFFAVTMNVSFQAMAGAILDGIRRYFAANPPGGPAAPATTVASSATTVGAPSASSATTRCCSGWKAGWSAAA